jgi:hypothetical protein
MQVYHQSFLSPTDPSPSAEPKTSSPTQRQLFGGSLPELKLVPSSGDSLVEAKDVELGDVAMDCNLDFLPAIGSSWYRQRYSSI